MKLDKAYQYRRSTDRYSAGVDILPYQLSLGVTLRHSGDFSPAARVYVGPIKIWATLK